MSDSNETTPAPVTVTVPGSISVPVTIARADVDFIDCDLSKLAPAALTFLFMYGLRQNLNDAKAGESDAGKARAAMEKRWNRLVSGDFGTRGPAAGSGASDPVTVEATAMARKAVQTAMRQANIKKPTDHPDYNRLVAELAATPATRAAAESIVATRRAALSAAAPAGAGSGGLSLSALGLSAPPAAPDAAPESDGDAADGTDPDGDGSDSDPDATGAGD